MAKRKVKLSTLRSNVSHLRKMISRLEKTKISIPSKNYVAPSRIYQSGSRLRIDGKIYTPAELEKLAGKRVDWRIDVTKVLQDKLTSELYEIEKRTGGKSKRGKTLKAPELTPREREYARQGLELISNEAVRAMTDWLNSGSPSWKKNLYYHQMNNVALDKGSVMYFFDQMKITTSGNYEEILADLIAKIGE